ncbi:hypothetical protein [Halorhabdus amylolytica]|uniref:hypothetical protein n=1 Tax=Halorhabdus amylolytica TaxID=2559573 RepID=UPI0010AA0C09|nr:hypothetical protein [Halorhabdus amylolytica]
MTKRDAFWEALYDIRQYLGVLFRFTLFLTVVTAISILLSEPGSRSRELAYLNTVLVLGTAGAIGIVFSYARWRHDNKRPDN